MKQLFAYIRVSDPKQGKGVSLDEQRSIIEGYAARIGATLTVLGFVEVLICIPIWLFSGFAVDRFFLSWLFGINMYVALPWVLGAMLGILLMRRMTDRIEYRRSNGDNRLVLEKARP